MPILRNKHKDRYVVVSNAIAQDVRLSWKARGLMLYLLSLPDDWTFRFYDLVNRSECDGKDSLKGGLDELQRLGYLTIEQKRKYDGTWGEAVWTVNEEAAVCGKPADGIPATTKYTVDKVPSLSASPTEKQSSEAPYWKVTERDRPMAAMYNEVIEGIVQDSGTLPEDMPQTLREWIRYVANGSNPPARLATYVEHLYGRERVPSFPRLGALLKRHEAQHVVEALWRAAPQLPERPVDYAEKILSNWDEEDE